MQREARVDVVMYVRALERGAERAVRAGSRLSGVLPALRCAGAASLGASWWAAPVCAPLAITVPALWWRARSRSEAFAVMTAYQVSAGAELVGGVAQYLELGTAGSIGVLGGVATVVGAAWAACWVPSAEQKMLRAFGQLLLVVAVTTVPVLLGAYTVGHPLSAAGLVLPGAGFVGLGAVLVMWWLSARGPAALALLALACVGVVSRTALSDAREDVRVEGVDTRSRPAANATDFFGQWSVAQEALRRARAADAPIVVLPESAGGLWSPTMRALWAPWAEELRAEGRVALVGVTTTRTNGAYANEVAVLGGEPGERELFVAQRIPVPFAMWRPWALGGGGEHYEAHPLASGTVEVRGVRIGVLLCWEGALVAPALLSAAEGVDVFVLPANHALLGDAGLPSVLGAKAWGALFGVPVVVARNVGGDDV